MKFRITQTLVVEYEVNPEFYLPDATAPEDMLQLDIHSAETDPGLFWNEEDTEVSTVGEIIYDEEER